MYENTFPRDKNKLDSLCYRDRKRSGPLTCKASVLNLADFIQIIGVPDELLLLAGLLLDGFGDPDFVETVEELERGVVPIQVVVVSSHSRVFEGHVGQFLGFGHPLGFAWTATETPVR